MQATRARGSRWQPPGDLLVLAAVDRAHRHRFHEDYGDATLSEIADHLAMTWDSHASRRLRPIVARFSELGWLRRSRHRGQDRWALTDQGSERLIEALIDGIAEDLPESPQHREWRTARDYAAAHIDEIRGRLGELLANVRGMLDASEPLAAAEWLSCAELLRDLTEAVGVASYCLYERDEPDDAVADRDEGIEPSGSRCSWRHPPTWASRHGR